MNSSEAPTGLRPDQQLGPYQITSRIGAGGMGEVYRARDTRLGRDVAVKVLPSSFAQDPGRLRRFEQEARAADALRRRGPVSTEDAHSQLEPSRIVHGVQVAAARARACAPGSSGARPARGFLPDDGSYYGEIHCFDGLCADTPTLEDCREELLEALEERILFRVSRSLPLPDYLPARSRSSNA